MPTPMLMSGMDTGQVQAVSALYGFAPSRPSSSSGHASTLSSGCFSAPIPAYTSAGRLGPGPGPGPGPRPAPGHISTDDPLSPGSEDDDRNEIPWFTEDEIANHPPVRSASTEATALEGYPSPHAVNEIIYDYIRSLAPKKREKVLFSHAVDVAVRAVLRDPKGSGVKTSGFRNWVRRTFTLLRFGEEEVLCHDHRPVAVREQVYEVLCHCHQQAGHGGRDKTSAQVRKYYAWIPKEVIAKFVTKCPSCLNKRTQSSASLGDMSESQSFLISLQNAEQQLESGKPISLAAARAAALQAGYKPQTRVASASVSVSASVASASTSTFSSLSSGKAGGASGRSGGPSAGLRVKVDGANSLAGSGPRSAPEHLRIAGPTRPGGSMSRRSSYQPANAHANANVQGQGPIHGQAQALAFAHPFSHPRASAPTPAPAQGPGAAPSGVPGMTMGPDGTGAYFDSGPAPASRPSSSGSPFGFPPSFAQQQLAYPLVGAIVQPQPQSQPQSFLHPHPHPHPLSFAYDPENEEETEYEHDAGFPHSHELRMPMAHHVKTEPGTMSLPFNLMGFGSVQGYEHSTAPHAMTPMLDFDTAAAQTFEPSQGLSHAPQQPAFAGVSFSSTVPLGQMSHMGVGVGVGVGVGPSDLSSTHVQALRTAMSRPVQMAMLAPPELRRASSYGETSTRSFAPVNMARSVTSYGTGAPTAFQHAQHFGVAVSQTTGLDVGASGGPGTGPGPGPGMAPMYDGPESLGHGLPPNYSLGGPGMPSSISTTGARVQFGASDGIDPAFDIVALESNTAHAQFPYADMMTEMYRRASDSGTPYAPGRAPGGFVPGVMFGAAPSRPLTPVYSTGASPAAGLALGSGSATASASASAQVQSRAQKRARMMEYSVLGVGAPPAPSAAVGVHMSQIPPAMSPAVPEPALGAQMTTVNDGADVASGPGAALGQASTPRLARQHAQQELDMLEDLRAACAEHAQQEARLAVEAEEAARAALSGSADADASAVPRGRKRPRPEPESPLVLVCSPVAGAAISAQMSQAFIDGDAHARLVDAGAGAGPSEETMGSMNVRDVLDSRATATALGSDMDAEIDASTMEFCQLPEQTSPQRAFKREFDEAIARGGQFDIESIPPPIHGARHGEEQAPPGMDYHFAQSYLDSSSSGPGAPLPVDFSPMVLPGMAGVGSGSGRAIPSPMLGGNDEVDANAFDGGHSTHRGVRTAWTRWTPNMEIGAQFEIRRHSVAHVEGHEGGGGAYPFFDLGVVDGAALGPRLDLDPYAIQGQEQGQGGQSARRSSDIVPASLEVDRLVRIQQEAAAAAEAARRMLRGYDGDGNDDGEDNGDGGETALLMRERERAAAEEDENTLMQEMLDAGAIDFGFGSGFETEAGFGAGPEQAGVGAVAVGLGGEVDMSELLAQAHHSCVGAHEQGQELGQGVMSEMSAVPAATTRWLSPSPSPAPVPSPEPEPGIETVRMPTMPYQSAAGHVQVPLPPPGGVQMGYSAEIPPPLAVPSSRVGFGDLVFEAQSLAEADTGMRASPRMDGDNAQFAA